MRPTLITDDMNYWRIAPDPRLRGVVSCYWAVEGKDVSRDVRARECAEDLLIPDGLSEIVFNRGSTGFQRWRLGEPDHKRLMGGSYLIGGRSHSVNTQAPKPLNLAGVKLDSRFLRDIIRTPLSEFRDATLSLSELGDSQLLALEDSIANARCVQTVVGLLDNYFLAALRDLRDLQCGHTAVDALVARIQSDGGSTRIMSWAREQGVGTRSLERAFCAGIGMTPKHYARVIRFKRLYRALISTDAKKSPLGAGVEGFFDQSHFNREFRHFTGVAPGAKLAGRMKQEMQVADHLIASAL